MKTLNIALLALVACAREPGAVAAAPVDAAPSAGAVWSAEAPGGRVAIRQTALGTGCRISAVDASATLWSADSCAGTSEDLHYVSPDGDRLLVLYPLPEGTRGMDWSGATVARLFVRGKEERRLVGADLVALEHIVDMSHDYSWVKGVGSGGGAAPRYAEGGSAILVDVVGGATLTLGFDGSGVPGQRASPTIAAPTAGALPADSPALTAADAFESDETTLFRWQDTGGDLHFSLWRDIPRERRAIARRVTAMVGSVSGGGSPAPSGWAAELNRAFDARASKGSGRSSGADPNAGPKLNGLTDAQRHQQEMARLEAERAKNLKDAELWQAQRERNAQLDRARGEGWVR